MTTVSDELVGRVALAMYVPRWTGSVWDNETNSLQESYRVDARAAIAALSVPEFVLPLAEEMLREANAKVAYLYRGSVIVDHVRQPLPGGQQTGPGMRCADGDTLLDAYRAAKGERRGSDGRSR